MKNARFKFTLLGFAWSLAGILAFAATPTVAEVENPRPDMRVVDMRPSVNDQRNVYHNLHTTRIDGYMLRTPFMKKAYDMDLKEDMTEHPKQTVFLGPPTQGETGAMLPGTLQIDPGPTLVQKSAAAPNGDRKAGLRPQYWPLMKPLGTPGFFLPPTPPVIMSSSSLPPKYPHAVQVRLPTAYDIPCYVQPYLSDDNRNNVAQARDEELWEYEMTTFGVGPISDTQYQIIERENNQRFLELMFDPERWMWASQASTDMQRQQLSESAAQAAESTFETAVLTIQSHLINVANEAAAQPVSGNPLVKTVPQAVYMVQQMYKHVYIPMAILLLLPGAVMTQMKGLVKFGVMGETRDEDAISPWTGILRAMIAVFLIPATQLYVSYVIDIGNSMTYEVRRYITNEMLFPQELFEYTREQTYNAPHENARNALLPDVYHPESSPEKQREIRGDGRPTLLPHWDGKEYEMPEEDSEVERQTQLSAAMQLGYNCMNFLMGQALVVLTGFQLIMMCYLLLMGPIAAALFAWPAGFGNQGLFRRVFSTWVDAITILGLWRFWWMVVLACMCVRIAWLKELGDYTPNTQWEMMMFTCFMGLLLYVPFQPFEFKPGEVAAKVLEEGAKGAKAVGQGMGQMAQQSGSQQGQQLAAQMERTGEMTEVAARAFRGETGSLDSMNKLGNLASNPPQTGPNIYIQNAIIPPSATGQTGSAAPPPQHAPPPPVAGQAPSAQPVAHMGRSSPHRPAGVTPFAAPSAPTTVVVNRAGGKGHSSS